MRSGHSVVYEFDGDRYLKCLCRKALVEATYGGDIAVIAAGMGSDVGFIDHHVVGWIKAMPLSIGKQALDPGMRGIVADQPVLTWFENPRWT